MTNTYKALQRRTKETAANHTCCVISRLSFKGTWNVLPLKRRAVSCFCLRNGSCLEVRWRTASSHFYSYDQPYCSLAFDLCGYVRQNSHWLPPDLTTRSPCVLSAFVTCGPQWPCWLPWCGSCLASSVWVLSPGPSVPAAYHPHCHHKACFQGGREQPSLSSQWCQCFSPYDSLSSSWWEYLLVFPRENIQLVAYLILYLLVTELILAQLYRPFFNTPHGMQDLSSLTRDQTHVPWNGSIES